MMSKRLFFAMTLTGGMKESFDVFQRFFPQGHHVLNRTEWRGKEPRSCSVTSVKGRPHSVGDTGPVICDIEVTYRPNGCITYVGNTKYDGWDALVLDGTSDLPKYVRREVHDDVEFNDIYFGEFVEEVDVEAVKHVTHDAVLQELMQSGKFGGSIHSSFVAPHRSRPLKKIVLSGAPSGEGVDGFGTHILNINNSTPDLEQVLHEGLTKLMCEFIEGKASIKNMGNDSLTFVELSDSLVDCGPNEDGMDSLFDVLRFHTPSDFLEDLAKRLMSIYAIDVAVADGEKGGLVLRHENKE